MILPADILIGLLRLRKCSDDTFRSELKGGVSIVRELHVYPPAICICVCVNVFVLIHGQASCVCVNVFVLIHGQASCVCVNVFVLMCLF